MVRRCVFLAAVALAQVPAQQPARQPAGQPPAVELQKSLYLQNAAGDLDGAIRKYREIIASRPSQRSIVAQAQYRLAQALLQKGDLNEAAQEVQNLALNYPDFKDLVKSMADAIPQPKQPIGTTEYGRYHHNLTGIEFNVPSGWKLAYEGASSDEGEQVGFVDPKTGLLVFVWMKLDGTYAPKIPDMLDYDQARKHVDREGVPGWTIRPGSTMRTVGGQQALSAVADFTMTTRSPGAAGTHTESTVPGVELMIWFRSTTCRGMFFGRARAEDMGDLQNALEQMMSSAKVP